MTTPIREDFNRVIERMAAESKTQRSQRGEQRARLIRIMEWLITFGLLIVISVTAVWLILAFLATTLPVH